MGRPETPPRDDPAEEALLAKKKWQRRQHARYRTRFAVGVGFGYAEHSSFEGMSVHTHAGLRQQLTGMLGLHLQLLALFASDYKSTDAYITATRSEFGGSIVPYFGPLGRFYVGPALYAGYRSYGNFRSPPSIGPSSTDPIRFPESRAFLDWGARSGVLVGPEEQVDITGLVATSLNNDAFLNGLVMLGASYEFR